MEKTLLEEVRFLIENIKPLLDTYNEEYEEHEMPFGYPTPDTYWITAGKIEAILNDQ